MDIHGTDRDTGAAVRRARYARDGSRGIAGDRPRKRIADEVAGRGIVIDQPIEGRIPGAIGPDVIEQPVVGDTEAATYDMLPSPNTS